MKKRLSLSVLLFLMLACISHSYAQAPGTPESPQYLRPTAPIDTLAPASETIRNAPLWRKSLVIIGDSYVANHRDKTENGWSYLLAQKYQMQYANYGRNGSCIAFDRHRWGVSMLNRLVELPLEADYVVIVAGHNDADSLGRNPAIRDEFVRNLGSFLDKMIDRYPTSRLAYVTPWNVDRPGFPEVLRLIREACASRSIPLFDAATSSGIYVNNARFRHLYFQGDNDTAHLNAKGHQLFLSKIEHFLLSL